jgi:hypothetical protein
MERKEAWIVLFIVITFLTLLLWESAYSAGRDACEEDVAKFCKDVRPGGGRIAACLKAHENELSPSCKASVGEARKKAWDWQQACAADASRFCKDTKPGGGRILKCLAANERDLDPRCKQALEEARKRSQ